MKTILILEDNAERIAAFQMAVKYLDAPYRLQIWHDAHSMIEECSASFAEAALISLDHDLVPQPGVTKDPGDGLEVATYLAGMMPVCPVLIHSSNTDRAWSMHNELRFANWSVDRVGPIGDDWIETTWLPKITEMLRDGANTWPARIVNLRAKPARDLRVKTSHL